MMISLTLLLLGSRQMQSPASDAPSKWQDHLVRVAQHERNNLSVRGRKNSTAKPSSKILRDDTTYVLDGKVIRAMTREEMARASEELNLAYSGIKAAVELADHGQTVEAKNMLRGYTGHTEIGLFATFAYGEICVLTEAYSEGFSTFYGAVREDSADDELVLFATAGSMSGHVVDGQKSFCDHYFLSTNSGIEGIETVIPKGVDLKASQISSLLGLSARYQIHGQDA